MNKLIISFFGLFFLMISSIIFAQQAPECHDTWSKSSAAQSCGWVCTNPDNVEHYPFSSTYNATQDTCTFNAGCCQGYPGQICTYNYAVCSPTAITVKKGDSQFYNNQGKLRHN